MLLFTYLVKETHLSLYGAQNVKHNDLHEVTSVADHRIQIPGKPNFVCENILKFEFYEIKE